MRKPVFAALVALVLLLSNISCNASPSSSFHTSNGEKYDEWGICRTQSGGENGFFQVRKKGFRPAIAFESVGSLRSEAWRAGERFAERYRGDELARQIFSYVRDRMAYTRDSVLFGRGEFARNADETAQDIATEGSTRGDCEDCAILLAVMFRAADLRSAVIVAPGHAATLVYLPDYSDANVCWEFKGEKGWVWAEATNRNNPLGWTPQEFRGSDLAAYEVEEEDVFAHEISKPTSPSGEGGIFFGGSSFSLMMVFLWLLPLLGRAVRK